MKAEEEEEATMEAVTAAAETVALATMEVVTAVAETAALAEVASLPVPAAGSP